MNPTIMHICTSPLIYPLIDRVGTIVIGLLESPLSGCDRAAILKAYNPPVIDLRRITNFCYKGTFA